MIEKMICPECGIEMNLHAEKLVYSDSASDVGAASGARVEEMHSCPNCGRAESRPQPHKASSL